MIKKNKFFLLIFFFITLTTYNLDEQRENPSIFFPIKKIIIENTLAVDLNKLKAELEFLRNSSLFYLQKKKITKILDKHDFISNTQIKKKYPNTLKILVFEKVPVAIEVIGKNKNYLTKEGKKIDYIELNAYKNLPVIFGSHKNFSSLFYELKKSNFKINTIKAFYYFDIGRWDVLLNDERVIKLPEVNYKRTLIEISLMLDDPNFSKFKIFDYRINNQLILQ